MNNSLFNSLNIEKIVTNLNKILDVANKVVPLYNKVKPIFNNIPTLNSILDLINTENKNDGINSNSSIKTENKKVSNNLPTFFQ